MTDVMAPETARLLSEFPSSEQGLRCGIWGILHAAAPLAHEHITPAVTPHRLSGGRQATEILFPGRMRLALVPSQKEQSLDDFAYEIGDGTCLVVWGEPRREGTAVSAEEIAERSLRRGLEACGDLEGTFLLVLADFRQRQVSVLTDHIASKPLFYASTTAGVFFGSSGRGVGNMLPAGRVVDRRFLLSLLTWGFLPGKETVYREVYRAQPASLLQLRSGSAQRKVSWSYGFSRQNGSGSAGPVDSQTLGEAVSQSVHRQLDGKANVGVLLSGGVDSRVLLGEVLRLGIRAEALTWTTKQTRTLPDSDVAIASRIAERLGVAHRIFEYDPIEAVTSDRFVQAADGGCLDMGFPEYSNALLQVGKHFDNIVRGDECLGWAERRTYFRQRVMRRLGLPSCYATPGLAQILSAKQLFAASKRNNAAVRPFLASARRASRDWIDVLDTIYFHARQFGYLRISSYARMEECAEVNPLLAKSILQLMMQTTPAMRVGKTLFEQYARDRFASLFEIPLANHTNLPDWTTLFCEDERFRGFLQVHVRAAEERLTDVFRLKKRGCLLGLLEYSHPTDSGRRGPIRNRAWRRWFHRVDQRVFGPLHVGPVDLAMRFVALAKIVDDAADVCDGREWRPCLETVT